jgi:hypothetical protein
MRRLFAIALVALGVLGCGSDSLAPVMTVDGQWYGLQNGYSLSLNLTQTASGDVGGTALIAGISGYTDATTTGTFNYPTLFLTITAVNFDPVVYTGTMSQTSAKIEGKLNGSGFTNLVLNVSKQR